MQIDLKRFSPESIMRNNCFYEVSSLKLTIKEYNIIITEKHENVEKNDGDKRIRQHKRRKQKVGIFW